jgi:hypothetical protein
MTHTERRLHKVVGLKAALEAIFKMREIAHRKPILTEKPWTPRVVDQHSIFCTSVKGPIRVEKTSISNTSFKFTNHKSARDHRKLYRKNESHAIGKKQVFSCPHTAINWAIIVGFQLWHSILFSG